MAITTNAMAAAGVQPKFSSVHPVAIVCTHAIASGMAVGDKVLLFYVAPNMSIVDAAIRLSGSLGTGTLLHLGTNADEIISSASGTVTTIARASKGLPIDCTTDTAVYLTLAGAAATAGATVYISLLLASTLNT